MAYIYKFNINGKSYVGSTGNIKQRMDCHKSRCNNKNSDYYNLKLYKFIRENGDWDNVDIHILQKCNYDIRRIVEDFYIKHYKCELNLISAIFDVEKANETKIKYYENNKELKKIRDREYAKKNKEKKKEYDKEYREKNKEKLNEKFNCMCGGKYTKKTKSMHEKTKKHQTYLASLSSSSSVSSFQFAGLK